MLPSSSKKEENLLVNIMTPPSRLHGLVETMETDSTKTETCLTQITSVISVWKMVMYHLSAGSLC